MSVTQLDHDNPTDEPIINNPYEFPKYYRSLDERGKVIPGKIHGRRPSGSYEVVPKSVGHGNVDESGTKENEKPYLNINKIRILVQEWRENEYPGVSITTKRLLTHWATSIDAGKRPYFCQSDAVETVVYVLEADESICPEVIEIRNELKQTNKKWNEEIFRIAAKMATATGKTWVIGMLILWETFRSNGKTGILIITPGLTVMERLDDDLNTDVKPNLFEELLPRNMARPNGLSVKILNYQKFRPGNLEYLGKLEGIGKKIVNTGMDKNNNPNKESYKKMLERLLRNHSHVEKLLIINDEAHHCYKTTEASKTDEIKKAEMWFTILKELKNTGRLENVIDLSATPMYQKQSDELENNLFPWIVSDYPLIDAIEAGLTKIPFIPTDDDSNYPDPLYRNLFSQLDKNETNLNHTSMNPDVAGLLTELAREHEKNSLKLTSGSPPHVMIVVANNISNAEELYKYIAGYINVKGKYVPGALPVFSNIKPDRTGPINMPPTLLVHSRIDEDEQNQEWEKVNSLQEVFFPKNDMTKDEYIKHIRDILRTVGKTGKPGGHIKCVISVSMLTEGWDAKTVSHIFGFRKFDSQLLCEQVAGRALRRTTILEPGRSDLPDPEYAGIYGVPFNFMEKGDSKKKLDTPPPTMCAHLKTEVNLG